MFEDNLFEIRRRIISASGKADRDAESIKVVAISKNRPLEQIIEVVKLGITDVGENRIQEAILKHNSIRNTSYFKLIKWHMVGHLQTNKVKEAVKIFDLIQSVDSLRLADKIDKEAAKINKIQDILIEVKTSPEATKFGMLPDETVTFLRDASQFKNINIRGFMTMAPMVDDPEKCRPYFRLLRELRNKINGLSTLNHELLTLSMGMTDDFQVAIEEGSNMIRLGRAIFDVKNM